MSAPMNLLDSLERRCRWLAVPNLIRYVVALSALVYVLTYFNPDFVSVLTLNPERIVRHGEIWRLITYIFIPQTLGQSGSLLQPLMVLIALLFLLFIGDRLEEAWGAFRLTLYFLVGMAGTTVAAFAFGAQFSNTMLASSLFFAFAHFYPEEVIYLFFVLPVKVKWLAWALAAFLVFGLIAETMSYRMALIVSLANYLLFFGPDHFRAARNRQSVSVRRRRFERDALDESALHRCAICGATEQTNPDLEFRVARDGEEYCLAHLPSATEKVGA